LWALVLFLLSAESQLPPGGWDLLGDKAAHGVAYAVFGATLAWGRIRSGGIPSRPLLLVLGILWALSDEWHQSFVPGREPSAWDLVADGVGLLVGLLGAGTLLGLRAHRPRPPG
jgi:VanZ family protein